MLELKNIRFDVQEGTEEIGIIRDVSFTIPDNKFVVVTGPNGGGKSTLARLIAGIEKPTEGTILLDGEDITQKSITDRARMGISYAMQQPVRFKGIQVLDLLRLAAGKRVTVAEACQYLSRVGLCAKDYIMREVNASENRMNVLHPWKSNAKTGLPGVYRHRSGYQIQVASNQYHFRDRYLAFYHLTLLGRRYK